MTPKPDREPVPPRPRWRPVGVVVALVGAASAMLFAFTIGKLPWGAPLVVLGLGGMALALSGLALWCMVNPLVRPEAALPEPPRAPARLRELEREKQMVLKAIKEVELDYQMRKISEGDWKDMTQRYRARALRLLSELDAGDDVRALIEQELKHRLAIPAATPAAACPSCEATNDADAVFCKKCGKKLRAEGLA